MESILNVFYLQWVALKTLLEKHFKSSTWMVSSCGKCHKLWILLPDCLRPRGLITFVPTEFKELVESSKGHWQGQIRPVLIIAEYNFPDSLTAIKTWEKSKGGMRRWQNIYFITLSLSLCNTILIVIWLRINFEIRQEFNSYKIKYSILIFKANNGHWDNLTFCIR